ncbi:uncharacterized protein [Palaemon carinicauda]|uniref:uncharacterized protein n=1 Tax=Palaemon carinicauda TaxID=392227 RepID=UPI0035B641AC
MAIPRAYIRFIRNLLSSIFLTSITLFILSIYDYNNSDFPRSLSSYFHNTSVKNVRTKASHTPSTLTDTAYSSTSTLSDQIHSNIGGIARNIGSGVVKESKKRIGFIGKHSKIKFNSHKDILGKGEDSRNRVASPHEESKIKETSNVKKDSMTNIGGLNSSDINFKYRYEAIVDKERKTKSLWKYDKGCNDFQVYFAKKGALPVCALASYPGSGNTWTRRLLEYASGIFTGSIYSDQQLFLYGYFGELEHWTQGTTIVQKTHDCGPNHIEAFNKSAILLLRNPYRAILSFHNYLFAGHTGFAPITNYRRKDWSLFVHLQAKSWLELAVNWTVMTQPDAFTVLHYETLKKDPVPSLKRAIESRNLLWDPRRMDCLQRAHSYKIFKRKEEFIPENLEIFSAKDRDKIDRAIRYVDYLLRKKGKESLPLHLYEFYNGTDSNQITRVPCKTTESVAECDDRIDQLNQARKRNETLENHNETLAKLRNSTTFNKSSPLRRNTAKKKKRNTGEWLTNMFMNLVKNIKKDPIDLLFHQSSSISLQSRDLSLETEGHEEAFKLLQDFKGKPLIVKHF